MFFAQKLSLKYIDSENEKFLFEGLDISLSKGDRLFLLGSNGSGKSSLIEILARRKSPTTGSLVEWPDIEKVFYLPQTYESQFSKDELELELWEYIAKRIEDWWEAIIFINAKFGRDIDPKSKIKNLSGGEIFQLLIAVGLLKTPDLILLDEPTNHIDLSLKLKLIELLNKSKIPLIVASHDGYFIEKVANKILELKESKFRDFTGLYSEYLEELENEKLARERELEVAHKQEAKLKVALNRANDRAQKVKSKGERAIRENDNSIPKIVRHAYRSWAQVQHGKKATDLKSKVSESQDKIDDLRVNEKKLFINLEPIDKRNSLIVEYSADQLRTDDNARLLISKPEMKIYFRDKILLTGENGSGKTTLLNEIHRKILNDWKFNAFLLDQKYRVLSLTLNIKQNLMKVKKNIEDKEIYKYLAQFGLLEKVDIDATIGELSGGQRAKVAFIMLLLAKPDFLIMDEPTNNLDMETVNSLKVALELYNGSFIIVTHDLQFAESIIPTHIYKIENQRLYDTIRSL